MAWINLADKPEGKVIDETTIIRDSKSKHIIPFATIKNNGSWIVEPELYNKFLSRYEYLDETVPTYGYSREQVEKEVRNAIAYMDEATGHYLGADSLNELCDKYFKDNPIPTPQQEQDGWVSVKDSDSPEGEPVLLFNSEWIDEDFNPKGTREGFLTDEGYKAAKWCDYHDNYETMEDAKPTHWRELPVPPKQ